jgi:RNA polymerase sigma-70 factor (ECF subfamily)
VSSRRLPLNGQPYPVLALVNPAPRADAHGDSEITDVRPQPAQPEVLLERIKAQDGDALGQFFDAYAGVVFAIGVRLLREPGAADQVVQDVFNLVWNYADFFDRSRESAYNWLLRVTYWRAIRLRRQPGTSQEKLSEAFEKWFPRVLDPRIHDTFDGVDKIRRRILILFFFEGKTLREISDMLGEPIKLVRKHYVIGLQQLCVDRDTIEPASNARASETSARQESCPRATP